MNPHLAAALARRGRTWGERNAQTLRAIRAGANLVGPHGGPSLDGCHPFSVSVSQARFSYRIGGYRRIAEPAP